MAHGFRSIGAEIHYDLPQGHEDSNVSNSPASTLTANPKGNCIDDGLARSTAQGSKGCVCWVLAKTGCARYPKTTRDNPLERTLDPKLEMPPAFVQIRGSNPNALKQPA